MAVNTWCFACNKGKKKVEKMSMLGSIFFAGLRQRLCLWGFQHVKELFDVHDVQWA